MKFGVVVFPGSNCDHDAFYAIGNVLGKPVEFIWHQSEDLANCDAIILPGGFSYGNYLRDQATLTELEKNRQVIFRYTTPDGSDDNAGNPNGAVHNIAGVCNRERNVAGLMPHPERAVESALGSCDGLVIFRSMVEALVGAANATA